MRTRSPDLVIDFGSNTILPQRPTKATKGALGKRTVLDNNRGALAGVETTLLALGNWGAFCRSFTDEVDQRMPSGPAQESGIHIRFPSASAAGGKLAG